MLARLGRSEDDTACCRQCLLPYPEGDWESYDFCPWCDLSIRGLEERIDESRKIILDVRFGNDEPAKRVLRVELIDGKLSVWLNDHPQLQGRPMSTATAGFRPKPWDPALAKAPSRVQLGAWLNHHTTNASYEQTVVLGAAHVLAMP